MSFPTKTIIALFMIKIVFTFYVKAQSEIIEDDLIVVSGNVNCVDPVNGKMTLVSIYNISKEWGTYSGSNGEFEIKMGKYDTIMFFTAEHQDFNYFLQDNDKFDDHFVTIFMEPDAIWLETVNIIEISLLEEFKMDVLNMEVAKGNISIVDAARNKYAKELSTGKPLPVLIGPLTYLQRKFSKQYMMKMQMQKSDRR